MTQQYQLLVFVSDLYYDGLCDKINDEINTYSGNYYLEKIDYFGMESEEHDASAFLLFRKLPEAIYRAKANAANIATSGLVNE
jgi:hypothetical protein